MKFVTAVTLISLLCAFIQVLCLIISICFKEPPETIISEASESIRNFVKR